MSVERMKYVNIVGPIDQFDAFVLQYILNSSIQPEHALSQVRNLKGLNPFFDDNPYDELVNRAEIINGIMEVRLNDYCFEDCDYAKEPPDISASMAYLSALEEKLESISTEIEKKQAETDENRQILKQLIPIRNLKFKMEDLFHLEYMKIRFGKVPTGSFRKMDMVTKGLDVVVIPFLNDDREVWICYVMPAAAEEKIDNVMSSLYFERIWISGKAKGYPADEIVAMEKAIKEMENEMIRLKDRLHAVIQEEREAFVRIYSQALYFQQAFALRKYAAHTHETFYITGWMPEKSYQALAGQLKDCKDIILSVEDPENVRGLKPPTILKNNRFFKPFEAIVKMYGIPAHNEFDPTALVAVSYILMFGAMFGDVGQGAILAMAGLYMFYGRKSRLGWVLACVGVSSIVFGFLYGSIFGNEHLLQPLWKRPMENISQLLILSIGYGVAVILLSIVINIFNSLKARNYGRLLFDRNGVAGLVFYCGTLTSVLLILLRGSAAVSVTPAAVILLIPLLVMLFREKLERIIFSHHGEDRGGSFAESFFEVFEAVLGFLSNTVSFVRVSAFALSHAGLALAVWTLYDMVGGLGKIIVIVIGNLLIIGLEGLIVGIQCLRLQYYEMFSRFFSGDGREFQPIRLHTGNGGQ